MGFNPLLSGIETVKINTHANYLITYHYFSIKKLVLSNKVLRHKILRSEKAKALSEFVVVNDTLLKC